MPIFEIQGPDGTTYEVDAPDEASAVRGFKKFSAPTQPPAGRHLSFEEGQALLDAEERDSRAKGVSGAVGAALTGVVDGVPVLGPMALGATQRAAAGLSTLIDGGSYDERLKQAQDITSAAQEAHPYVTTGANIAGAVGGTIPLMMAAPGAFGAGPGSFAVRSGASALSGSAVGGADSAVRSDGDLKQTGKGVRNGFIAGLAGPAVGSVVGAAYRGIANRFADRAAASAAGTTPGAVRDLAKTAADDGLDAAAMRARLDELGPDAMIADLGPGFQGKAASLAAIPGRAQSITRDALNQRQAGANARIGAALDDNLGPAQVPSQMTESLKANQRILGPGYDEAFQGAAPHDIRIIASDLDKSIGRLRGAAQRKLVEVRGMLNETGANRVSTDPRVAFETRNAIDGMLATEVDTKVIGVLTEARQMLDDALTRSVPGLKRVDAQYAELARQREAIGRGQQVLDSGRTAPRPPELAAELQAGAQPGPFQMGPSAVPLRLSQGARAGIDRIVGTNANDVAALNRLIKGEGDWNRQKLGMLFGQEKADRVFRVLESERQFAATHNVVTRNSETARRMEGIAEVRGAHGGDFVRNAYAAGGAPGLIRSTGLKMADKAVNVFAGPVIDRQRAALAEALTRNPDALIGAIEGYGSRARTSPELERIAKALILSGATTGPR